MGSQQWLLLIDGGLFLEMTIMISWQYLNVSVKVNLKLSRSRLLDTKGERRMRIIYNGDVFAQGVWVSVFVIRQSSRFAVFLGGYAVFHSKLAFFAADMQFFQFLPPHPWPMTAHPLFPGSYPLPKKMQIHCKKWQIHYKKYKSRPPPPPPPKWKSTLRLTKNQTQHMAKRHFYQVA